MTRNRTHGLFVQGGVRLDHLADVILSRYPDARLTENMVRLDLGVPEPQTVLEPITDVESLAYRHLPEMYGLRTVRGVSDKLDKMLDEVTEMLDKLTESPEIAELCRSFEEKRSKNFAAWSASAKFEDNERNELQELLAKEPEPHVGA